MESETLVANGQRPTKVQFSGQWVTVMRNPGLFARNRYGPGIYRHQEHWMDIGHGTGWAFYNPGSFSTCAQPGHSGCLDKFSSDGNLQFSDYPFVWFSDTSGKFTIFIINASFKNVSWRRRNSIKSLITPEDTNSWADNAPTNSKLQNPSPQPGIWPSSVPGGWGIRTLPSPQRLCLILWLDFSFFLWIWLIFIIWNYLGSFCLNWILLKLTFYLPSVVCDLHRFIFHYTCQTLVKRKKNVDSVKIYKSKWRSILKEITKI